MILSSCHDYSLNNDCHCHFRCHFYFRFHYMRRIYLFYGLTWFKLLITSLTWQEHTLSSLSSLYDSLYFGLVRFTTIHQMLLFIIIFLDIKHFDLNFCDVIIIEIHYHLNKRASWEREQEWCHAIFFFFFLLNFVYYIASISSYPANMAAYLKVINLWWFHYSE